MKKITFVSIISLIIIFITLLTVSSISGCKSPKLKELDVYVWEGYLPESVIALFEQETEIKLNITLISETTEMLNMLKGGGSADIFMPSQHHLNRVYENNLSQPIDLKTITNYKNVSRTLREQSWAKWDGSQMGSGEVHAIPFVFGTSGLVINSSKYTKPFDNIGWNILLDPDLKARVSARGYSLESVLLALELSGIPLDNLETDTEETLKNIREKAIELKNNVLKFYETGSEIIDLVKNEEVWVSHIWDGGGRELATSDSKFKYVLPVTGGFGWIDTLMISANSKNIEGAHIFINFILRPEIAAVITEQSGFNTTVEGALDITKGIDKDLYIFTDEELSNLKWPPTLTEQSRSIAISFWEEISTIP